MRQGLLLLLLISGLSSASAGSTWQMSGVGATLGYRGVVASSAALNPPPGVTGSMTLIAWHYQLMTPEPAGLLVKLCSVSRCIELDGPSGTSKAFSGIPASQPLRFVWEVPGRGSFYPPLRVTSNQVIVNYTP